MGNYVKRKDQEHVLKGAKGIYQAASKPEAIRRYEKWASRWRGIYPKAVDCLEKDLSCFQDTQSCERVIFGVFSYLNKKWKEHPIKNFKFTQFS